MGWSGWAEAAADGEVGSHGGADVGEIGVLERPRHTGRVCGPCWKTIFFQRVNRVRIKLGRAGIVVGDKAGRTRGQRRGDDDVAVDRRREDETSLIVRMLADQIYATRGERDVRRQLSIDTLMPLDNSFGFGW